MSNQSNERKRGQHALQLLEDELLQEAFEKVRQHMLYAWEESPPRDQEGREILYISVKMLERVHAYLREVLETGRLASYEKDPTYH